MALDAANPPNPAPATSTLAAPPPAAPASPPAAAQPAAPAPAAVALASTTPPAAPPGTPEKPAADAAPPEPESLLKAPEPQKQESATETGEKAKAEQVAEVEVKVPDGVTVNGALVDDLKALAKADGLSSATAQKVLDLGLKLQQSLVEDLDRSLEKYKAESIATLRKEWGSQFDANVVAAQKVVTKFGDPNLLKELAGLENSPAVMRTLARIGKALGEDTVAVPGARSAPAPTPRKSVTGDATIDALADSLYPSMHKD